MAQVGAAPNVLKFLKSVQYIQRYHLLKYPVNPTLSALHCWEIAGKQGWKTWYSKKRKKYGLPVRYVRLGCNKMLYQPEVGLG